MIDLSQRMIMINSQREVEGINAAMKRHLEIQIKAPQNAPRDAEISCK